MTLKINYTFSIVCNYKSYTCTRRRVSWNIVLKYFKSLDNVFNKFPHNYLIYYKHVESFKIGSRSAIPVVRHLLNLNRARKYYVKSFFWRKIHDGGMKLKELPSYPGATHVYLFISRKYDLEAMRLKLAFF